MSLNDSLLDIICCPVTHSPLAPLGARELERLNARIGEGQIKNRGDEVVAAVLEAALVTRDGKLAYPVRDDIPVLLEEQGILMSQLDG